jgi:anti-sigma-K factor RskA
MTERASNAHDHWEELAAGHALDALEPEETEAFTAHLATCSRCQDVLADHAFVAAQLGSLVEESEAPPSWERIRSGVVPGTRVASLAEARERRRAPRLLTAAASVVLVAAASVTGWQLTRGDEGGSGQQQVLAACAHQAGCRTVHLQDKATLVVDEAGVRLLASSLRPPAAGRVYVLWQLPRQGRPTMVGTLDETRDGSVGERHALALPYEDTTAFGLSLEPASTVPTGPTDLVALGSA